MSNTLSRDARATLRVLVGSALGILPIKEMFTDWGWIVDVWLTMAILILPAVALRGRQRPAAWQLLPGLVLAALFLTARFLPDHAILGVVPGSGTPSDLGQLSRLVRTAMSDDTAPVHTSPAIRFYLAAGLGLVAALIDVVAICLRSPALTGIAFLLTVTLSGAVSRHAVGWVLVGLAAVGYLLVLSSGAGSDLARWGRRAPDPGGGGAALRSRAGETGRRIGAISLVLGLLVAALVPIPSGNIVANALHHSNGDNSGNGTGSGKIYLDPLATLKGQLTKSTPVNLFDVQLANTSGNEPYYLRQEVLEDYTGAAWIPGGSNNLVPGPIKSGAFTGVPAVHTDRTADDTYTAKIHIQQLGGTPPVFYLPDALTGSGSDWHWDTGTQLVVGQVSKNQSYTEQVQQPRPTAAQLKASDATVAAAAQRDLQLPDNIPAGVKRYEDAAVTGATTPYDKALGIFNFFADPANNFIYNLSTKPGDSGSDLLDFLNNKQGYCQQYAAAMGVMLRMAGVPARVVLGYTHSPADKNGHFEVTTNDAHAWVEAYFSGIGWVPFDPTPLTGTDTARAASLPWAPRNAGDTGTSTVVPSAVPNPQQSQDKGSSSSASTKSTTSAAAGGWAKYGPLVGLIILALLLVCLVPAEVRWIRRRRRMAAAGAGDPLALWSELRDTCVDLGIGWSSARSPRQVVTWLREFGLDREGVIALRTITDAVELFSYGPTSGVDEVLGQDLGASLRVVRHQLIGAAESGTRWKARLLPSSLWRTANVHSIRRTGSRV